MMAGTKDTSSQTYIEAMIKEIKWFDAVAPLFNKTSLFMGGPVAGMRSLAFTFIHHMQRNVLGDATTLERLTGVGVYAGCQGGYSTYNKDEKLDNAFFRQLLKHKNLWKLESPGETNCSQERRDPRYIFVC
jgi:hypothetical protein